MTEHRNAQQQQFADRLRTALGKQSRRSGGLRRRVSTSPRSFAERLRSSLR